MQAKCNDVDHRTQNSFMERLSPMVGIKGALSTVWNNLRCQIHDIFIATEPSRRAIIVGIEHVEDTSVLDPSADWYTAHRNVYVEEIRKVTEGDSEFVVRVAEIITNANLDLSARLARAAEELKLDEETPCLGGVAIDASAFMVSLDILYSSSFMNISQRSWPAFLRCQTDVFTDAALNFVAGNSADGAADSSTRSSSSSKKAHEKDWLFDRFESEAIAAVDQVWTTEN
jgi:hypothetical protein